MTEDDEALFEAVKEGNLTQVRNLLNNGTDVNFSKHQNKETVVYISPYFSPIFPSYISPYFSPIFPLTLAILTANPDMVKLLLEKKADTELNTAGINQLGVVCICMINYVWMVPYHDTVRRIEKDKLKLYKIAKLLLNAGTKVNFKNTETGNTSLQHLINIRESLGTRNELEKLINLLVKYVSTE